MSKSLYTTFVEETAPTTSTVGEVGQLYLDTSTKTLYQCVEVDTTTPSYTWQAVGGSRKYQHNITISHTVFDGGNITSLRQICFSLINEQNNAMNYANIATHLKSLNTTQFKYINATGGYYNVSTSSFESLYFGVMSGNGINIQMIKNAFSVNQFDIDTMNTSATVNDIVVEL